MSGTVKCLRNSSAKDEKTVRIMLFQTHVIRQMHYFYDSFILLWCFCILLKLESRSCTIHCNCIDIDSAIA